MSTDLVRQRPTIDEMKSVAKAHAMSGYWPDTRDVAQAFVKVSFGYEVGLPAYVAMSEVHIIQGKPTLGAGALAALVKSHPNYDYRVLDHTDELCEIEFYTGAESLGVSKFTMQHAKDAGLTGNATYKKYPRNMLFARAMSNGVAWFCPDVTLGRVYTPDEIDPGFFEDSSGASVAPQATEGGPDEQGPEAAAHTPAPPIDVEDAEYVDVPDEPAEPEGQFVAPGEKQASLAGVDDDLPF